MAETVAEEPPTPITHGADARAWRHLLGNVLHTQSMLRYMALHQYPQMYAWLNERFARYDDVTAMLNNVLSRGFGPDCERLFIINMHQFRTALWSVSQLLRQAGHPAMPALLNQMTSSVRAATRLLRQLNDEPPATDSHQPMLHRLEEILLKLERASTVESCQSVLDELDAKRRQLQQEVTTQRLLQGFTEVPPSTRRASPWRWGARPQEVMTLQTAYAAPQPSGEVPPRGSPYRIPFVTSHGTSRGVLYAAAPLASASVPPAPSWGRPGHPHEGAQSQQARPHALPATHDRTHPLAHGSGWPQQTPLQSADILPGTDDRLEPAKRAARRKLPGVEVPVEGEAPLRQTLRQKLKQKIRQPFRPPLGPLAGRITTSTATTTTTATGTATRPHVGPVAPSSPSKGATTSVLLPLPSSGDNSQALGSQTLVLPVPAAAIGEPLAPPAEEPE